MNTKTILIGWLALASPLLADEPMPHHTGAMMGYMGAMDGMMADMGQMASTGDADADFLMMMIPHHRSALNMAKVALEQGDDAETRALAERIIKAQTEEIAEMEAMLRRMGVAAPE